MIDEICMLKNIIDSEVLANVGIFTSQGVIVTLAGGKLNMKGEKFTCVAEIEGDSLKETLTLGGVSMTRWSKRC